MNDSKSIVPDYRALLAVILVILAISGCATVQYSPEELALVRKVEKAIFFAPELANPSVHVSVRDGVVILQGNVKSGFDRWIAERTALEVDGVTQVYNYIYVRRRGSD